MSAEVKKLYRSVDERMIAGICGGLGEYFKLDPTIMRLIFAALAVITGFVPMVIIYFILWVIVPPRPGLSPVVTPPVASDVIDTTAKE